MIKLVALDMDGTLLDSKKQLPGDFIPWVKKHDELKIVIASGRQYYTLEKDFETIRDELVFIADNGALVFAKGEIIYKDPMKKEAVKKSLDIVKQINTEYKEKSGDKEDLAYAIACGVKCAYYTTTDEEVKNNTFMYYVRKEWIESFDKLPDDDIVKVAIFFKGKQAEANLAKITSLVEKENVAPVLSGVSWIDIANAGINKGSAVKQIQKTYCITAKESMAFGDYLNDYDLLAAVEESYAMANGHEKIKEMARHQTSSNDEDGVMKILRNL